MYKSLLKLNFPSYVIFFITSKCNARCRFCFYWKNIEESDKKKELDLEEIEKIWEKDFVFEPKMDAKSRKARFDKWHLAFKGTRFISGDARRPRK